MFMLVLLRQIQESKTLERGRWRRTKGDGRQAMLIWLLRQQTAEGKDTRTDVFLVSHCGRDKRNS